MLANNLLRSDHSSIWCALMNKAYFLVGSLKNKDWIVGKMSDDCVVSNFHELLLG